MTEEDQVDQIDFFYSLKQAIKDAGGDPEQLMRMDLNLSRLCRTLAPYGIRFVYGLDNTGPTPAQRAGFEVGDFAIYTPRLRSAADAGTLLRLEKDDCSVMPRWEVLSSKGENEEGKLRWVRITRVTKLQPAEQANAPTLTLTQQAGFEEGDFGITQEGDVVNLARDDGTINPYWRNLSGEFAGLTRRISLSQVRRLVPVQESNDG